MIAIIDYDMGNLCSVENALERLGCSYELTCDPLVIMNADKVLLPGVGNAAQAMLNLKERNLCGLIKSLRQPVLGICVGMQIMCKYSEEGGETECLGIFDAGVHRFMATQEAKVPHMGWNAIGNLEGKLFKDIPGGSFVYFVHSYYPSLCQDTVATCRHGDKLFSAALRWENFYGTQFHPEKSSDIGFHILKNFIDL